MAAQTAIVTGASSGIGRELARLFAADGYNVVLVARQADALNALVAEIARERPVRMRALAIDLSHLDAPRRIEEDLARAGEVADVVVNNAGFGLQGAFADLPRSRASATTDGSAARFWSSQARRTSSACRSCVCRHGGSSGRSSSG